MCRCVSFLALVLLLAGVGSSAQGSQILYMSPQDLGEEAALVIRGRVQSVESYWNSRHTKIFTRTRLAVDETYKGGVRPTIDVIQPGGVVGTVKVTVQGALQWTVGEEVLLFAEPSGPSDFRVAGFSQGKFKIVRDAATNAAYIEGPPLEGVNLLGAPSPSRSDRSLPQRQATLEQFINQALSGSRNPGVER
jgi:hypothetical protein